MRLALRARRSAFSLLEMVLALALGMILLLALYVAFSTYIFEAQAGRELVAEATLARNILTRMGNDISGQLGPVDPRIYDYSGGAAAAPATPAPATNGTSSTTTTTTTQTTPMPAAMPMASGEASNVFQYNVGVNGKTEGVLVLSNYRVRKAPTGAQPETVRASDVVATVYWVVPDGNGTLGLARAEIREATHPDIDVANIDPKALNDQNKYIIAPEVKKIAFEYFDGSAWHADWDGQYSASLDGSVPPQGPPAAIRITITLKRNARGVSDETVDGPTYQQIVAIPAGNNFPAAAP